MAIMAFILGLNNKDRLKSLAFDLISTPNPKSKYKLLRSGVVRIKTVISPFKSVMKKLKNLNRGART